MLTDDQRIAIDMAIGCLSKHGDAFAELGAMTVLQELVAKTYTLELTEEDALWVKSVIQNPLHGGESLDEGRQRQRIWDAAEKAGVPTT